MARLAHNPEQYRRYAQSPAGRAARSRAHAKYVQTRRELREMNEPLHVDHRPLAQALKEWR